MGSHKFDLSLFFALFFALFPNLIVFQVFLGSKPIIGEKYEIPTRTDIGKKNQFLKMREKKRLIIHKK